MLITLKPSKPEPYKKVMELISSLKMDISPASEVIGKKNGIQGIGADKKHPEVLKKHTLVNLIQPKNA